MLRTWHISKNSYNLSSHNNTMSTRTRHTRKESRLAVYRVLLDVFEAKAANKKFTLAHFCAKHHCGNINGEIIRAFDFSKMPLYDDAIVVLKANSDYKRSCNVGTRKTAKQAIDEAKDNHESASVEEVKEAYATVNLSGLDLQPDEHTLFPEQSLIPKAIAICQRAGYIVSRPL